MTVSEIKTRVRAAIDEMTANDSSFIESTSDEVNLTNIITYNIYNALQYVLQYSSQDLFDSTTAVSLTDSYITENGSMDEDLVYSVKLPDNILRIVAARLSSWRRSTIPVGENSVEYEMQGDDYARGSYDRPVSVMVHKNGGLYLEMYSGRTSTDTPSVTIITNPTTSTTSVTDTTDIPVPKKLESAYIYEVAGLTLLSLREEIASSMLAIARQFMGITAET